MRYAPPNIGETSFSCAHCGALAQQFWFDVWATMREDDSPIPVVINDIEEKIDIYNSIPDQNLRDELISWATRMASKAPFLENSNEGKWINHQAYNINISSCYNCRKISVWIHDHLVFPHISDVEPPNPDMPDDIRQDYEEASSIVHRSPRGAAALTRLAIQKLCKELGQPGTNINNDIGSLVKNGLDTRVQQALDSVRVIGNNAVHPGKIDLSDDKSTAITLLKLLNFIVDKTISEPKHIAELYASLPEASLKSIEKRDK